MGKTKKYLIYALGYLGIAILTQTVVKWYQYFYAPPEVNQYGLQVLIPIGFVGVAMIVARLVDGIADPLVAYFSDKSKHPLGRRIPFILYGVGPLVVTFILLWFPPVAGQSIINLVYLAVLLSLFFTFFTVVVTPYLALIGELTETREERIRVTTFQGIAQILGVMVAEAGSGVIINAYNFKVMGIVLGLIALVTIALTPIFIREEKRELATPATLSMWKSMGRTLRNTNFRCLLISYVTVWFGINTLTITMPYKTEVLMGRTADYSGFLIAAAFVVALLFSPVIPYLHKRASKGRILFFTSISFGGILILTGLFGTIISDGVAAVIVGLAGIPLAIIFVVPNAMVVDIAQGDAIANGENRAAMFFGIQGLIIKLVIGVSSLYTPLLFGAFGYSTARPLGIQLAGPIAGLLIMVGALVLLKYNLDEGALEKHEQENRKLV
ncbi:MAG: MFS transporter [Bacillus sp. (in: Bacteria)]|nr:MFS transporter [Bacillus sp. (in: firmicutes)]